MATDTAPYPRGRRLALVALCSVLSLPGFALSLLFPLSSLWQLGHLPEGGASLLNVLLSGMMLYAWLSFAMLCAGWVRNRPVARHWRRWGALAGLACAALMFMALWLVLLAGYLLYFHYFVLAKVHP